MIPRVVGLVVVAAVLGVGVVQPLAIRGIAPDLSTLVLVAAAGAGGPRVGAVTGFGTGLLLDLDAMSTFPLGSTALGLTLVGSLVGVLLPARLDARGRPPRLLCAVAVLGGCVVGGLLCLGVGAVADGWPSYVDVARSTLGVGLASALLAPLVVPPVVRFLGTPSTSHPT